MAEMHCRFDHDDTEIRDLQIAGFDSACVPSLAISCLGENDRAPATERGNAALFRQWTRKRQHIGMTMEGGSVNGWTEMPANGKIN